MSLGYGDEEEGDGSKETPMITDPVAETHTELTDSPPLFFILMAFPAFNDGVFYTKIWGGKPH